MPKLFRRLSMAGFERAFVTKHVLPDWWEESLAANPASMAMAEIAISRVLGISVVDLREPTKPLALRPALQVRLKRRANAKADDLIPAITIAERLADSVAASLQRLPAFSGAKTAEEARSEILARSARMDLAALVDYSWSQGIAVIHAKHLPGKRPTGIAMFAGDRPVVILCSGYDSPPWLAFHLAHELGHVFGGHVARGQQALADESLDRFGTDPEEIEADEFACSVLSGRGRPPAQAPIFGMTQEKLADTVRVSGALGQVDPGYIALRYGFAANRMPVAQGALKILNLHKGGQAIIDAALRARLADNLPETARQFVALALAD